jgi:hypothetical protein
MKLKLNEAVSSPNDLRGLISELGDYAKWYGQNAIKKQVHAKHISHEQPELSPAAKAILQEWASEHPVTRASLDELIQSLERHVKDARVMTITLAAPATTGIKKQLTAWCRDNVAPDVLVRFEFNQTLLGGMVVRFGSHIYDWSLRRQILDGRTKFPEVLRNV